jgi:hypothetical protein
VPFLLFSVATNHTLVSMIIRGGLGAFFVGASVQAATQWLITGNPAKAGEWNFCHSTQ